MSQFNQNPYVNGIMNEQQLNQIRYALYKYCIVVRKPKLGPIPIVVDALTGRGSLYHHGEIYPCTYEECKELEVCAAWHINQVIDMLMGDDKWDKSIRKPRKE